MKRLMKIFEKFERFMARADDVVFFDDDEVMMEEIPEMMRWFGGRMHDLDYSYVCDVL